ncbi:RNA-directed DNA polymerase [Kordiimonas sp.]|uniref:RNA-directed DNA polymerase n=1 Tax=Kordiimonas sp. TaxID=1970157 RepID=UPI003A8DA530
MSAAKLSADDYVWAIKHLVLFGDTDIFPHPMEFEFLEAKTAEIAESLAKIPLRNHRVTSLVETLHPKSRYGFRMAHQMFPIDAVIFSAATVSIAAEIESARGDAPKTAELNKAFSYRYINHSEDYRMFSDAHRYGDWRECLSTNTIFTANFTNVITTDISDFYQRIYRHRLENCLNSYTRNSPFVKFLENCMNDWRGRQSFGIPVGSNACRLLAEAALCDTDQALLSEGYQYTRYVDDIVVLLTEDQDPYTALAFLAGHLMVNEGLSLNSQKTKILSLEQYISSLNHDSGEDREQAEQASITKLYWAAYGEDEAIDEEALAELKARELLPELEEEMSEDHWDIGRIRILLRAIRLTKSRAASEFIVRRFKDLIPFIKDVVLVIEELKKDGDASFDKMSEFIVDLLLSDTLRTLQASRAWLFELFVRDLLPIDNNQIKRLSVLSETLDKRYLITLRYKLGDINFFRKQKTRINELSPWEQPVLIWGARCLPKDEYTHWVRSIKSRVQFSLGAEFCDWCIDSHSG